MNNGTIQTLFKDRQQQNPIYPKTKMRAVTDDDGNRLDVLLGDMVYVGERASTAQTVPLDADTLGGRLPSEYATENFVKNEIAKAQLEGEDVDLSGLATKDEVDEHTRNKNNPHGVTAVQVGARPADWLPTANEVGAAPAGYGLGTTAVEILDANTAVKNGWYKLTSVDINEAHIPFQYVMLHVIAYDHRYVVQDLYRTINDGTHFRRVMVDSVWGDWINMSSAFAPAGYGYGDKQYIGINSGADFGVVIDNLTASWENCVARQYLLYYPDFYIQSLLVTIYKYDANNVLITGHTMNGYGASVKKVGGTWYSAEWENPPMTGGVEYRTTERHEGKVVYTKLINCGNLPNYSTKNVSTGGIRSDKVISFAVTPSIAGDSGLTYNGNILNNDMGTTCRFCIFGTNINILSIADYSGWTATCVIKYIKD